MSKLKIPIVTLLLFGILLMSLCACSGSFKVPPDDPLYAEQTNLSTIKIEEAWKSGLTGKGVKIAIIDTGVCEHPDLDSGRISGKSYVDEDVKDLTDVRGHGTFIAGMLAATQNNGQGIAGMTLSKLVILKIWGENTHVNIDDMAQAIRDAVDEYDCDVINISMGTPNDNEKLKSAVDYAVSKGAIIVAAAGGDKDTPYYPAAYDNVVGVDAVDEKGELPEGAVNNESVFVTAPGTKIASLAFYGGYERYGAGASYAAVQVTAMAAFAKGVRGSITSGEFMELLKASVTDKGEAGYDTGFGWGIIDAGALTAKLKE